MPHHPEPPSHSESGRLRRLGRDYGWLAAAGGLAAVVLLCSVPFVTGTGLTWNSAGPVTARSEPVAGEPSPGGTALGVPETDGPPTVSPSPTSPTPAEAVPRAPRQPAARASTAGPAPTERRTTAPPAPRTVLLGPSDGMGLWQMLRSYCLNRYGTQEAQLRRGTGEAENNWECRSRWGSALIDMDAACRAAYQDGAFARYGDRNDAFSWRCYRTT